MSQEIADWVEDRLDQDVDLSDDAKMIVLAAVEGETELAEMTGFTPTRRAGRAVPPEPVSAYLHQIVVEGFRGIGPRSVLDLDPYPSLTVVAGRNGSGKSSFAEALDVALTGTSYRWSKRTQQWRECWRNLHRGEPARVVVNLAESDGLGDTTVRAEWAQDATLNEVATVVQRKGGKQLPGVASLGWDVPLELYRPILSYEELGSMLTSEPKVLYDALSTVLGLEHLTDAVKALEACRKPMVAPQAQLTSAKKELVAALKELDDDRASRALKLMRAHTLDVVALTELVAGQVKDDGSGVSRLLEVGIPSVADCHAAAAGLRAAVSRLADVGDRVGESTDARLELLTAVLAVHSHDGDQPCPVCGIGTLDATRVASIQVELETHRAELAELRDARAGYTVALARARQLTQLSPLPVTQTPDPIRSELGALRDVWKQWTTAPEDPLDLSNHLQADCEKHQAAIATARTAVETYLAGLDREWADVAERVRTYLVDAASWEAQKGQADTVTAAYNWLKQHETVLKNERVRPIAEQAKRIWSDLRQESNVEIAGLRLEGSATRRHVVIDAEVDGEQAAGLTVMSQGELHSLALALFLPRATMPTSPFRFVMLDDPVQAMDPAKVEGLVQTLLEIAKSRQVIVFTHDDRFASAVRRCPHDVPVKILEVRREANSVVNVTVVASPAGRYLEDARAIANDTRLPLETLRRVLPGLCRMAVEAQAHEIFFSRELGYGTPHEEVEHQWASASKTQGRVALAVNGTDVGAWLDKNPYRRRAVRLSNSGMHDGLDGNPKAVCDDVEKVIQDLASGAK